MGETLSDRLSWSIRVPRDDTGQRTFEELLSWIKDRLTLHFPPAGGYEVYGTQLSGPLEGVRWSVTRGLFRADLGVQRFARPHRDGHRMDALRIVATAGLRDPGAHDSRALERRVVGWALASWLMGGGGLLALWLGSQGVVAVWVQLLLIIPAIAAWRAAVMALVRRAGPGRPALPPSSPMKALPLPEVRGDRRRWRTLLQELELRREQLEDAGRLPFRNPGHLELSGSTPAALPGRVLVSALPPAE